MSGRLEQALGSAALGDCGAVAGDDLDQVGPADHGSENPGEALRLVGPGHQSPRAPVFDRPDVDLARTGQIHPQQPGGLLPEVEERGYLKHARNMLPKLWVVKSVLEGLDCIPRFPVVPQRFNELLAAYLRRAGMTATSLGALTDVAQSTMSRIALGQRAPDLDKLDTWADVLDLDPTERGAFTLAGQLAHCPTPIIELIERMDGERDALVRRIERLEIAVRVFKGQDPEGPAAPAGRRSPPRAR